MSSPPKHNLVALSSAAIIAVYAAGYMRTRSAAARVAEHEERRPPMRATTPREPRQAAMVEPEPAVARPVAAVSGPKPSKAPKTPRSVTRDTAVVARAT